MKITRFEELDIWKEARELYKYVFLLTLRDPFCKDFRFCDQIRSSSGSVSDNIAEGFDRGGNKEFIQFLSFSKGSCGEVRNQAYRAFDSNYIKQDELDDLLNRTDILSGKITTLSKYLKSSNHKGPKYDNPKY